jgi:cell pole-organizing protein PopZ
MLAEWLEAHLPAMVEKLVQDEIARIVGKRR